MDDAQLSHDTPPSAAAAAACWICGSATSPHPRYPGTGLLRCDTCGFAFTPASAQDLHAVYVDSYFDDYGPEGGYDQTAEHREHDAGIRGALLSATCSPGRLLEVGCASGFFLAEAARRGFDCEGIEPSPTEAERARERAGVPVFAGAVEDADLQDGSFDVVCAWHVLEHIAEPVGTLRRLRAALKPGGVLLLELPNAASRAAAHFGMKWPALQLQYHVNQFTPGSLGLALEKAGFAAPALETVSSWTYALPASRRSPKELAARVKFRAIAGAPLGRPHPDRHELLRAVARVPAAG